MGLAKDWRVPAALILLSAVPILGGAFRMTELLRGAEVTPDNARFVAAPLPVVVHILSASFYSVLGAFQFSPGLRRRRLRWHRAAGRLLVPLGLAVALSALWMTQFYPNTAGGELLYGLRLLFGSAMVLSIVLGVAAIQRRDFARHGAWMMRGYAIGMGAGTQFLTQLLWALIVGTSGDLSIALLHGAGWVINLVVAERIIRTRRGQRTRMASVALSRP